MMEIGIPALVGLIIAGAALCVVVWTAARRLKDGLATALGDATDRLARTVPPDLVAMVESLDRRMTDLADMTERRYRAILQRDRRAADADGVADVAPPAPQVSAAPTRPRLMRRYRRE